MVGKSWGPNLRLCRGVRRTTAKEGSGGGGESLLTPSPDDYRLRMSDCQNPRLMRRSSSDLIDANPVDTHALPHAHLPPSLHPVFRFPLSSSSSHHQIAAPDRCCSFRYFSPSLRLSVSICVSLCLSFYSLFLSRFLSIYLCLYAFVSVSSLTLSVSASRSLALSLARLLSVSVAVSLAPSLFASFFYTSRLLSLFVSLSAFPCLCKCLPSICLCLWLSCFVERGVDTGAGTSRRRRGGSGDRAGFIVPPLSLSVDHIALDMLRPLIDLILTHTQ